MAEVEAITKEEFCARFIKRMTILAPFTAFDDGTLVKDYAKETAPTYWENEDQRADGPEECADADMSYWGE